MKRGGECFALARRCPPRGIVFGEQCGNNRKILSCFLVEYFCGELAERRPNNQRKFLTHVLLGGGSTVCQRARRAPDLSVDSGAGAELKAVLTVKARLSMRQVFIFRRFGFPRLAPLRSASPYVRSSPWAASTPLTSCMPPLLAICSPAWPSWSGARRRLTRHMSEHAVRRESSLLNPSPS